MRGKCALTQKETDLRNSHIYPKFAIEWMKTIGSKYLRSYVEPNKRQQDGYKVYLLSEEAEQLFSKREKWFSENVFHKYLTNISSEIKYNENLFYFAISFLWRILVLELRQPFAKDFMYRNLMIDTENQWRDFLYHGFYPKDYDNVHLILTDTPIHHTFPSDNVDFFLTKSFDGTIAYSLDNRKCSVFAKFSKFIFWAFLAGDEKGMNGTKINPINGTLKHPQNFNNDFFKGFIEHRIHSYDDMVKASPKQQEIILQEIKKNINDPKKSEIFDSIEYDYYMKKKNKGNKW